MPRETEYRIVVANSNVPNMLGQVSTVLAEGGLNIHDMVNKSRNDLAFTIVDVDSELTEDTCKKLKAIEGVLSVRIV